MLLHCRMTNDDPYAWLQSQLHPTIRTTDTNAIIGVNIPHPAINKSLILALTV